MTKRIALTTAALTLLLLAINRPATAQSISPLCDNSLIRGTYGFTIEGQKLINGPGGFGPQVGVAMTTFDGNGTLQQIDTVTIGGVLVSDFSHAPATGTYQVNGDCTGTFTLEFQDGRPNMTANFVVMQNGNEIDTVVIPPPGTTVGALATRSIGKRRFASRD